MIHVSRRPEGVRLWLDDALSADAVYVDADWIHQRGNVAALIVRDAGDADAAAARALTRVAKSAVAACGERPVEVCGRGMVAAAVRLLVGGAPGPVGSRPGAIVETTGAAEAIAAACSRVADLGLVVLAGETADGRIDLNLYPDVHVRGLVLVGVPPPHVHGAESADEDERLAIDCLGRLVTVGPGEELPPAAWYRLRKD